MFKRHSLHTALIDFISIPHHCLQTSHSTPLQDGNPPLARARLVLVDDHPIFLQGVNAVLQTQPDMTVCGQATNAHDALRAIEILKPDLVLLDVSLEGSHGIDLIKGFKSIHPGLRIIVLSMHDEALYAGSALRAGAQGYVMKRLSSQHLLAAIRKILGGGMAFSEDVTSRALQFSAGRTSGRNAQLTGKLSDRELQILELFGQGMSTRKIAETLHLSIKTVQTHREHLKAKLELVDGLSLIRFALLWVESERRIS